MDRFLLDHYANKLKCDYFITGDKSLIDLINESPEITQIIDFTSVLSREDFLNWV